MQLKAYQTALRQAMIRNENRTPMEFELLQLVLFHLQPIERMKYKAAFYKALPRWTFPHRVVRVLPPKHSALVKCLITGNIRQVHLQDVRFILPPNGPIQEEEWKQALQDEAATMYDPETANRVVSLFFEALNEPQRDIPLEEQESVTPTRKRRRRVDPTV